MKIRLSRVASGLRCSCFVALVALTTGLFFAGCAKKTGPSAPEQQALVHTVAYQGETFTIISAWYTGSGQNWRELAAANPEVKPNRLRPGTMIRIPRVLLTRETALPKSFVDTANSKLKSMPPEKGMEDTATQPVSNPVAETPKATPPVFDEQPTFTQPDVQPEAPVALPVLPDPNVASSSSEAPPPMIESSSSAAPVPELVKMVEPVKPIVASSSSSSAAPVGKDDDHQKTRDQLLKELLQDY